MDFINFATKRRTVVPEALKTAFKLIPAGDGRLKALGIGRALRYQSDLSA